MQAGHEVDVVAAQLGNSTTSSVAAALWYPYRAYPEADVTRWSATTYEVLCRLTSDPSAGVRMRLGRELFRQHTADPWWRGAVPELGRVPDERLPTGYVDGYELSVPVVDMAMHLPWLHGQLETAGVTVRTRHVDDLAGAFDDVDVVVNCPGLGSRELIHDRTLTPVRGQVIVVAQVGLTEWLLDQSVPEQLTYVVPRSDTVLLGGTAEEDDEELSVRPETTAGILKRCIELVPALEKAPILSQRVGLRPGRPSVRLETGFIDRGPVVHCYGHGGAGVTLSYGCAEDVAALVSGLS
ncbi:FAD-dependent oxidoreductase [Micromonospora soli]